MSRVRIPLSLVALSCAQIAYAPCVFAGPHDELISKHATAHGVPPSLVRRVIHIESKGNARAVSKGNYGLMQIRLGTARAMGYRGTEQGLLDADTNMTYAVKYLAGAYRAAGCNEGRAVAYYQRGYHGARRAQCSTPMSATTQIAERPVEKNPAAQRSAHAEPATVAARGAVERAAQQAGDVLRPRLVQTQTISRPKLERKPELPPAAAKVEPAPVPAAPTLAAASAAPAQMRPMDLELTGSASLERVPVSPPGELTLKDVLTPPVTQSRLEPMPKPPVADRRANAAVDTNANAAPAPLTSIQAPQTRPSLKIAKLEPDAVPVPRARPAVARPASQAIAALDPDAVPVPVAKPEIVPARGRQATPAHSGPHKRVRSDKRVREEPGFLARLKKLITPDAPPRKRVTRR